VVLADAAVPDEAAAFDRQGVTADDLIDFTPALRAEALEGMKAFRMGPIFTPPSLAMTADGTQGTIVLPSFTGGANWEGGSFDPETNVLYVGSYTQPSVAALAARGEFLEHAAHSRAGRGAAVPRRCCRLIKPPWGRITAIDMNKGEHLFQIPNGPTPKEITEHPKLKGLDIAPTGRATRPVVLATKSLLFSAEGWGGTPRAARATTRRRARCSRTFRCLGRSGGLPMSYMIDGKAVHRRFDGGLSAARRSSRCHCRNSGQRAAAVAGATRPPRRVGMRAPRSVCGFAATNRASHSPHSQALPCARLPRSACSDRRRTHSPPRRWIASASLI
jgi:hypothetical protein